KLKTAEQIEAFLRENIKGKEKDFSKIFDELPETDKPTGNTEEEKIKNFLAKQKAEVVIKKILKFKLQDEVYLKEIETEMESNKDNSGKVLDESVYPKKDGEYTKEAMIKYLFEKKTGQNHQFATKEQKEGNNPS